MSKESVEKIIKEMEDFRKNMTPEDARDMLIRMGIIDVETGELTEQYQPYDTNYEYERKFIFSEDITGVSFFENIEILNKFNKVSIEQLYITDNIRFRKSTQQPDTTKYTIEEKVNKSNLIKRYEKLLYESFGDDLSGFFIKMKECRNTISKERYVYIDETKILPKEIKNICFDSYLDRFTIEVEFNKNGKVSKQEITTIVRQILEKPAIELTEVTQNGAYYAYNMIKHNK